MPRQGLQLSHHRSGGRLGQARHGQVGLGHEQEQIFFMLKLQLRNRLHIADAAQAEGQQGGGVASTGSAATMPMEKLRTLLALLLKKISTPGRLKKLGFGSRLIDEVLKESILASGRTPVDQGDLSDRDALTANIQILLDWTIPDEYMTFFKAEKKSVEEILEELAA